MRVAWATAEVPHHAGWGGPIRQAHLLDALSRVAEVDLLVLGRVEDDAVRDAVHSVVELPDVTTRPESSFRRRVRTLVPSPPVELRGSRASRAALAAALQDRSSDVVVLPHGEVGALVHERPDVLAHRRPVVDLHHLASVRHDHAAATATGRERALHRVEARRSRRHEHAMAARAHRVVVCSPDDAAHLPGSVLVPNGASLDAVATPVPAAPRVVFTGHLAYEPNVDAVGWLLGEVVPRVRARSPVEVVVVGRSPGRDVRGMVAATDGVELAEDVPEIRPYLDAARIAVVPVRVGSGTRLKALEAMAAGRPVVGTTIGLEGLGVVDGQHALVADDATEFADAIVRALHDDGLADRLATAGRRLAEGFGWESVGRRFVEAVLA